MNHPTASDRRESAAKGLLWLVNQRYGRLILPTPWNAFSLKYQYVTSWQPEFATIQNTSGVTQIQNAMRDTRMRRTGPPPPVEGSRTLTSIRGDRQQIERRSGSPMRGTDIAQKEPPGPLPNRYLLVRSLDLPKAGLPADRRAPGRASLSQSLCRRQLR